LEGLKLKIQYFGHLMQSTDSLEKTLMLEKINEGIPVHHQFPELAQTHVLQVGDAIQPSHPLLSPSPAFINLF